MILKMFLASTECTAQRILFGRSFVESITPVSVAARWNETEMCLLLTVFGLFEFAVDCVVPGTVIQRAFDLRFSNFSVNEISTISLTSLNDISPEQ